MFVKTLILTLLITFKAIHCQLNHPLCASVDSNLTLLNTLNGKVRGSCYNPTIYYETKPISTINPILTWFKIPFAKPPVGSLRFKSPVPVQSWTNVLDGTRFSKQCYQDNSSDNSNSSEDCLYLNIYRPLNSLNRKLPILVWIHGGSFVAGSGSLYDGSFLALTQNIIVVTINYRLGAFGFFYLSGTDAVGNQALRDQNLALKWVYNNAHTFGGDQKRITLDGQSAGR